MTRSAQSLGQPLLSPSQSTASNNSNASNSGGDDSSTIVRLMGNFDHSDASGQHLCIAMERLGPNLYQLADSFEENGGDQEAGGTRRSGLPMPVVKSVARQVGGCTFISI